MAKVNPNKLPWFPFYAEKYLCSRTVANMTMTERGIYTTLMVMCWVDGSIPWDKKELSKLMHVDQRVIGRFMDKYTSLTETLRDISKKVTQTLPEPYTDVTLPKLQEFAETLGKNKGEDSTDKTKTESKKKTDTTTVVSESVPISNQKQRPLPPTSSFDPLTFGESVTSKSGSVYSSEQVSHILSYHFKHSPNKYWADTAQGNVTSLPRLIQAIDSMAGQVPADWTPPAPKQPKTRLAGDPSCLKCRGLGWVSKKMEGSLSRVQAECDCPRHEEVAVGKGWKVVAKDELSPDPLEKLQTMGI